MPLLLAAITLAASATAFEWNASSGSPFESHQTDAWPESGTLILDFTVNRILLPDLARGSTGGVHQPILSTPLFDAALTTRPSVVALQLAVRRKSPLQPIEGQLAQVMWSRLEPSRPYQLALVWNVTENRIRAYLNGIRQEEISPIRVPYWEAGVPPLENARLALHERLKSGDGPLALNRIRLLNTAIDEVSLSMMARESGAASLEGEGRTLLSGAIETPHPVESWSADLSGSLDLEFERDLFANGVRVRRPAATWVLEGEGTARAQDGAILLQTARRMPSSHWTDGRPVWTNPAPLVLWLNRPLPKNWLVSYDLNVEDCLRGLHLLFFSAQTPDGGSIFGEGLPFRNGEFERYIRDPSHILSYHVSVWGAPYDHPRGSSNLRRNGHFLLLSVGDDRVASSGTTGPHRIRVLRIGGRIVAEVNGVRVIDHREDPLRHGPSLEGGLLGLRMMGEAGSIRIRNLIIDTLPSQEP